MRRLWVKLHLWMASFLAAILLMIAVSGGLYLFDEKGSTVQTTIPVPEGIALDLTSGTLETAVKTFLTDLDINHQFEYIKRSGTILVTRPTSQTYFEIQIGAKALNLIRHDPDWIKVIVELHKGHGPVWYKRFQQFTAAGLVFVLLSGLWLGASSKGLRAQTFVAVSLGIVVWLLLAFIL